MNRAVLPFCLRANAVSPTPYALSTGVNRYSTSKMQQASHDIVFSVDQASDVRPRALKLLSAWELSSSNKGITRHYTFSSFAKAWKFMSIVAEECKVQKHHPSWTNLYNKVTVEWTTHKPEGLSGKDVEMAEFCDRIAEDIGLKG